MGAILSIFMMIDGFKTIGGLVISGVGVVTRVAGAEDVGRDIQDFGNLVTGIGATHGGIKRYKGK